MRAAILAALIAIVGCGRGEPPPAPPPPPPSLPPTLLEPFGEIVEGTPLTDDAIVAAIVGTGGDPSERWQVERLAREVVLPTMNDLGREVADLTYGVLRDRFRTTERTDRVTAVALVVTEERTWISSLLAEELALARVHRDRLPEVTIASVRVAAIEPSTIETLAREMRRDLERLRELASPYVPEVFGRHEVPRGSDAHTAQALLWVAELNLRIAERGDYTESEGRVYALLTAHGVPTKEPDWLD